MTKINFTASWITIGVVGISSSIALAEDGDKKPLTLSLGLKGFYDDNIFTRSSKPEKVDSFGFQIAPSIGYKISNGPTTFSIGYTFDAKWFERRSRDTVYLDPTTGRPAVSKPDPWDYAHYLKARVEHRFSDSLSVEAADAFSVTREPQEALSGQVARSQGDATFNFASLKSDVGLTDLLGLQVAYKNNLYDYRDEGYKGSLNRIENIPSLDVRYRINPDVVGLVGYRYSDIAYDKNGVLVPASGSQAAIPSDSRNRSSHFVYGGADYQASPTLSFALRAGAEFTDFNNVEKYSLNNKKSTTSPYVDFNTTWNFQKGSYFKAGVRHELNSTDAVYPSTISTTSTSIILNQESTLVYASVGHDLTSDFRVSLNGQFQDSEFKGGQYDGKSEAFYSFGILFSYRLNPYLTAEASYFYDKLAAANVPELESRGYSRNRVFLGVRATY